MIIAYGVAQSALSNPDMEPGGLLNGGLQQLQTVTLTAGQINLMLSALAAGGTTMLNGVATVVPAYDNDGFTGMIGYDTVNQLFFAALLKT